MTDDAVNALTGDVVNAFIYRAEASGSWNVGVKDVIDVAGMPTTAGSQMLFAKPTQDAGAVRRLREAGATIVGKTNTHEFAFGPLNDRGPYGPALNPWDHARITGGSSGGSAAAVAAGLCDCAIGTDTGGSIRVPSALCGVTGMRPTASIVPTDGMFPTAWTFDTIGPIARSARECARALSAMAGRQMQLSSIGTGIRVGVVTGLFESAEPSIADACEQAVQLLPGERQDVEIPMRDEVAVATQLIMLPEAANVHLRMMRSRLDEYLPDVRRRLLTGLLLPPTSYVTGQRARAWLRTEYEKALGAFDLIVAPAMPIVAPLRDDVPHDFAQKLIPYNSHWSLFGCPAASVPCGFVGGLPIGLCIAGRPGDDAMVLSAAHAFQQRTEWHLQKPPQAGE